MRHRRADRVFEQRRGLRCRWRVYCCAMKDVFSNRIVGYSVADRMKSRLAVTVLRDAIAG